MLGINTRAGGDGGAAGCRSHQVARSNADRPEVRVQLGRYRAQLGGTARRSAIMLTSRRSYSLLAYKPRDFDARELEAAGDTDCRVAARKPNPIRVTARCR